METKFIIFVIFVGLVRSPSASSADTIYGLSEEESGALGRIVITQEVTISGKVNGFNPIFDLIQKYSSKLIYNLKDVSSDDPAIIAAAFVKVQDTLDYFLDAIQVALETSDSVVEEFHKTVSSSLNNSFEIFSSALTLAASGDFDVDQAQLATYRDTVRDERRDSIDAIFDFLNSLLDTTDSNVLAIFELAHDASRLGIDHLTYAIFNAITVYGAAVFSGQRNVTLIAENEAYRRNGLDGIIADVSYTFIPLRTIYIYSKLGLPSSSLPALYANQIALDVATRSHKTVDQTVFDIIEVYARDVSLGLSDSGTADFSLANASAALSIAKLTLGYQVFIDSILVAHPDAESAITEAREQLSTVSAAVISAIFDLIEVARNPAISYIESLEIIETYKTTISNSSSTFVIPFFDLIRNGESWDSESEAEFNTLGDAAINQPGNILTHILDGVIVLAKVVDAGSLSDSDISAFKAAHAAADSEVEVFTQTTSAAGVVQIKAAAYSV